MNLPTEVFGDVVVVHTPEELSADHADSVEAFLNTLDHNHVILDLDNTELIDGAGLTMLLDAQEHLSEPRHQRTLRAYQGREGNREG